MRRERDGRSEGGREGERRKNKENSWDAGAQKEGHQAIGHKRK
jgi:hypothetical protein